MPLKKIPFAETPQIARIVNAWINLQILQIVRAKNIMYALHRSAEERHGFVEKWQQ